MGREGGGGREPLVSEETEEHVLVSLFMTDCSGVASVAEGVKATMTLTVWSLVPGCRSKVICSF